MRIFVKRENWEDGIWMRLPATEEEAEQVRRSLEEQHPSIMLPFIGAVDSRFPELENRLVGEIVFPAKNLDRLNQMAERLGSLNGEEEMLFRAAFRLEAPYTTEQILETLGHLDRYRLHPEIGSFEELGKYLSQEETSQLPEGLEVYVDYAEIGRLRQEDRGYLTEGGYVEKRKDIMEQTEAGEGQSREKESETEKRQGFQGKNLFRFLNSKRKDLAVSKNTYYRFLNDTSFNWTRFLLLLSAKVTSAFSALTRPERIKVLVLDDSVVKRNRSKAVELLARVYDHAEHKYQKGFTMLTLGWSDGYSFVPVGFNLLSSAKKSNRYQEISDQIDHRTNGYKARKESLLSKPEAAIRLIRRALAAGIQADYVLMDTWFTTEPMLAKILETGPDVIGMVKQLKQRYSYRGKLYTLPELRRFVHYDNNKNIFGSIVVSTKTGIPVKIVIVRNRNKKSECLYLLSTDCSLSDSEIVRIYGNRWSIECFFKASKSFLKLGTEFQSRTYDAMVSHTAIVFTRYTILEWIRRKENDEKTYGELFFMFCDDIRDMDLTSALQSLMALFAEQLSTLSADITACIKSKVTEWMDSQAAFIQALFENICWES